MTNTLLKKIIYPLHGTYALAVFALIALLLIPVLVLLPGLAQRRGVARFAARAFFWLIGVPLSTEASHRIPGGASIVVANHASYLDGIILTAALPARFSFVIKKEMSRMPLAHLILRRIGSQFVERSDRNKGAADARRIFRTASNGEALAFFPEGTFHRSPGLGRFQNGAFVAAARARLPIVPVVIRGSRQVLPEGRWLPRIGCIEVRIQEPIAPGGLDAPGVRELKRRSRASILQELDEQDLLKTELDAPCLEADLG